MAGAALWLCSDAAASVNGHALSLSGGEILSQTRPQALEPLSKDRLRLWLRLLKVTGHVESELRRRLRADHATTLPRFDVMAALARHPKGLRMSDLSEFLRVSNGNVTALSTG